MVRVFQVGLLLLVTSIFGGCEAASLGADVIGSTFDVAREAAVAGKSETFVAMPWETATEATRKAADKLALKFVEERPHADRRKLIFTDDRKQEVTFTVVRRTSNMTELRVDVGLFGPHDEARLALRELLKELQVPPEDRQRED